MVIRLNKKHPWNQPMLNAWESRRRADWYSETKRKYRSLSPSRRRLVNAFYYAMYLYDDPPKSGFPAFQDHVSRKQIAAKLRRKKLYTWDIQGLEVLCEMGWLQKKKIVRPMKGWQPTGYEYVYTMHPDRLWCLWDLLIERRLERAAKREASKPVPKASAASQAKIKQPPPPLRRHSESGAYENNLGSLEDMTNNLLTPGLETRQRAPWWQFWKQA